MNIGVLPIPRSRPEMEPEVPIFAIQSGHRLALMGFSVALLALVLELVRRDLLKERYALLWLGTSVFGLVVGLFPSIIERTAAAFSFQLVTLLFVGAFGFLLLVILGYTVILSRLSERNRKLAQEIALVSQRLEVLEKERGDE